MGPGGPGMMGMGRTVTGAPYSGQEVTEESQTLANGNVITRKVTVNVFRDSSGRVRTERTVPAGAREWVAGREQRRQPPPRRRLVR